MQSNARRNFVRRAARRNRKSIRREGLRKRAARQNLRRYGGRLHPLSRAVMFVGYVAGIAAVLFHVPNILY